MIISAREYDYSKDYSPKEELLKQVDWNSGAAGHNVKSFGNLLDMLELRQKVQDPCWSPGTVRRGPRDANPDQAH